MNTSRPLKIVFMGSPDFAVPSLEKLNTSKHKILAVVSGSDKVRTRNGSPIPTPVKAKAISLGIPVIETDDLKNATLTQQLRILNADLFVVVAFRILPVEILNLPAFGSINLHASLLPKYRGAAPIHHAVMNGENETGCTIFFLNEQMDTGNILFQKSISIGPDETTGSLYERLSVTGSSLLADSVDIIATGNYSLSPQDNSLATPAPKIYPAQGKISFDQTPLEIHNLVRAFNPSPSAYVLLDGRKFKIHRVNAVPGKLQLNGQIHRESGMVFVGCKHGCVELKEVQIEGKKSMIASDFFNGYHGPRVLT